MGPDQSCVCAVIPVMVANVVINALESTHQFTDDLFLFKEGGCCTHFEEPIIRCAFWINADRIMGELGYQPREVLSVGDHVITIGCEIGASNFEKPRCSF